MFGSRVLQPLGGACPPLHTSPAAPQLFLLWGLILRAAVAAAAGGARIRVKVGGEELLEEGEEELSSLSLSSEEVKESRLSEEESLDELSLLLLELVTLLDLGKNKELSTALPEPTAPCSLLCCNNPKINSLP